MKVKRRLLNEVIQDKSKVKAVALAIYCKSRLEASPFVNYTKNKMHNFTELHSNTVGERIETLKALGLVRMEKKNLVFLRLSSKNSAHNIDICCENMSVKEIELEIYAKMFVEIIKNKEYIKQLIWKKNNPPLNISGKEYKSIRLKYRAYGCGSEYKEYGLSYEKIVQKLHVCLQKAYEIVSYAVEKGYVMKTTHIEQIYAKGVGAAAKFLMDICEENAVL